MLASLALMPSPAWGQSAWPSYPNNSAVSVTSGGNVGIGTASPGDLLEVKTGASSLAGISVKGSDNHGLHLAGSACGGCWSALVPDGDAVIQFSNGTINGGGLSIVPWGSGAKILRMTGIGNVGIGTANPLNKFVVSDGGAGGFEVNPSYTSGSANGTYLTSYDRLAGVYRDMMIDQGETLTVFKAGGNVGIGTTSPQHKLSVKGNIGAGEVIVTNVTGWADYVFRPGYRLQPLSEVDAYIQAHQHLPEIPSEADVKEKGVSVGEMQSKLLAKVEELTLHLIRQEKENRELREQQEIENRKLRERLAQLESRAIGTGPVAAAQ